MKAVALGHNTTAVYECQAGVSGDSDCAEAGQDFSDESGTYQVSSPDKVTVAQGTQSTGLTLMSRDLASMQQKTPGGQVLTYCVLQMSHFMLESRRMGSMAQDKSTARIAFYMKGPDFTMSSTVQDDWLQEEA